MKWRYFSENVAGNLHAAAEWMNERHPEGEIVAMDVAISLPDAMTIVVWREPVGGEDLICRYHTDVVFHRFVQERIAEALERSRMERSSG